MGRARFRRELGQPLFAKLLADGFLQRRHFSRRRRLIEPLHRRVVLGALGEGGQRLVLHKSGRREECLEAVVIVLGNRIELMIVTPRAAHRQTEKGERRGVGHVVERVVPALNLVGAVDHVRAEQVEAGRDERLGIGRP